MSKETFSSPSLSDQSTVDSSEICENRTVLAEKITHLKNATLNAAAKRERLPQPLFWSLFSSRLNEIKREKKRARSLVEFFERPLQDEDTSSIP